jgi:hypothetical protein
LIVLDVLLANENGIDWSGTHVATRMRRTDSVTGDTTLYVRWKGINGGSGVIGGSTPLSDNSLVISTNGKLTLPAGKTGEVSLKNAVSISIPANATDKELKLSQKPTLFYYDEVDEKWAEIGGEVRGN